MKSILDNKFEQNGDCYFLRRRFMKLCLFLLMAGLMDAALTHLGISFGLIEEGNPIMRLAIEKSWVIFYIIKICLPLALIGLYWLRPLIGWRRILLVSTCVLYFSVLCYHILWILLYMKHFPI